MKYSAKQDTSAYHIWWFDFYVDLLKDETKQTK
jgi:hypothetical protein